MTLLESLNNLCVKNLSPSNGWYQWRKINESKIPSNLNLPDGNQYAKNIALKKILHEAWSQEIDPIKKGEFIKYYISEWGGIRKNSSTSMQEYLTKSDISLMSKGEKGIASWSKALVIHNPNKYAIFDARVSIALNSIQIIDNVDGKKTYPILSSQNKKIKSGNRHIKHLSKEEQWGKVDTLNFYKDYLALLEKVAKNNNTDLSTVEMLLFSKAEELLFKAFPEQYNQFVRGNSL